MRRLLFSTSLLLVFGCTSQKSEVAKPKEEPIQKASSNSAMSDEKLESIATDVDRPAAASSGPKKMSAGKAVKGTNSDPASNEDPREMPKHSGPDQDKIDSKKQEEQKKKK